MNYFAVGFGVVALAALGAIDYANQASIAGAVPSGYSPGAYIASFSGRFGDRCVAGNGADLPGGNPDSRAAGAEVFLPDAPESWTRSAWLKPDGSSRVAPDTPPANQGWIYQRGDSSIAIRAEHVVAGDDCNQSRWFFGKLKKVAQTAGTGWAVIGGAAYGRVSDRLDADDPIITQAGAEYGSYEAVFGFDDIVRIRVVSTASETDLRALLSAVDYDGLNNLLSHPLPYFGSAAPDLPVGVQAKVADVLLQLQAGVALADGAADREAVMAARLSVLLAGRDAESGAEIEHAFTDAAQNKLAPVDPATRPASEAASKPRRLTLSGGKACLDGSASRFCRD
ncbi:hypothetical protein ACEWPM_001675 [Roseovarius sp. S4756]|uniref:hypothetical protein n=1 Tax=Roseovarius maritimus TaxID=3342637 RepID=UPI00372C6B26